MTRYSPWTGKNYMHNQTKIYQFPFWWMGVAVFGFPLSLMKGEMGVEEAVEPWVGYSSVSFMDQSCFRQKTLLYKIEQVRIHCVERYDPLRLLFLWWILSFISTRIIASIISSLVAYSLYLNIYYLMIYNGVAFVRKWTITIPKAYTSTAQLQSLSANTSFGK